MVLTNVSSNVLKLWLVCNELLFGWNVDAHVTRKPDWGRGNPDMHLSKRESKNLDCMGLITTGIQECYY